MYVVEDANPKSAADHENRIRLSARVTINESGKATFATAGAEGLALIFGSLMSLAQEANNNPRAVNRTTIAMFFMFVSLDE
jgi:hypothetical protein